jgi:murein DD-endopeptidase MepM/ murein hydrolase activator NlpD
LSRLGELCYNHFIQHDNKGGELLGIKKIKDKIISAAASLKGFFARRASNVSFVTRPVRKRLGQVAYMSKKGMGKVVRLMRLDTAIRFLGQKGLITDVVPVLVLLGLAGCMGYMEYTRPYQMFLGGQPLAMVSNEEVAKEALEEAIEALTKAYPGKTVPYYEGELAFSKDGVPYKTKPMEKSDLTQILTEHLDWTVSAWSIQVNKETIACVKSEADAKSVLDQVKSYYYPKDSTEVELLSAEFAESVQLVETEAKPAQLKEVAEVTALLIEGQGEVVQHTVQNGESFWSVADSNGMTIDELKEANPGVSTVLYVGQRLNLNKTEPLINVKMTMTATIQEKIAYSTVYEKDATIWKGQTKTVKEGVEGAKEVTYQISQVNGREESRVMVAESVITDATDKVVKTGTKVMTASRGGGGSGQLAWPFRGRITSPYGMRGRSMHAGLDIDGSTGDSIQAAEGGTVIMAGTNGAYGKCIQVDHGDGVVTLYGHLSAYDVSVGDTVSRGQLIGRMGSTGRSTGSHLHFEVRINGSTKNPLNYLGG